MRIAVKHDKTRLKGDSSRVVTRLHLPNPVSRIQRIIQRVANFDDTAAEKLLENLVDDFSRRHKDIGGVFSLHFEKVKKHLPPETTLSATKEALIGACFTMEYAIEAAALFNPSIVLHPDQTGIDNGCIRFIMSLRATGEGHVSSIVFRTGVLTRRNEVMYDPLSAYCKTQNVYVNPVYDRYHFQLKLNEMETCNEVTAHILAQLPEQFTYSEMREKIEALSANPVFAENRQKETGKIMYWLANSNYTMDFDDGSLLSERVIFPVSDNESSGIEDARFVRFVDEYGDARYYATYTAYNGVTILPQLLETLDFNLFRVITLNGKAVQNKGMALFPRKIGGKYVMLSRQDGENTHIMFSDNLHFWQESEVIHEPGMPWEFVQVGNCGSPLETGHGWLVLTHGVGPMRRYCIGAILLDREDPGKIIGRLKTPLLTPREEERDGYVPNVVYSCGAIIHHGELVIPFAMSDTLSGVVSVGVEELMAGMEMR
jgi:predicted GH43/DUF377 family glycosyl hydrolase